jgi:dipeptidyl aminopeptidase/acylaminoacyl peptidase
MNIGFPLASLPRILILAAWVLVALPGMPAHSATRADFTLAQMLHYPFASELVAADQSDVVAWVRDLDGARNIWLAHGPDFTPRQLTRYTEDDGQEITQLTFSPDGTRLVYVRGGDHDANWPGEGNLAPDPTHSPQQPVVAIWSVPLTGGEPLRVAEGDAPAISARGQLAYIKDGHVWTTTLDGHGEPEQLFFDRGKAHDLQWSPDGSRLAFVSNRGDHSFIGIFTSKDKPLVYLAPSTGRDHSPRWSPDGGRIAFVRLPGEGGPPEPLLQQTPHPWSIWVANTGDATGHRVWQSPNTLAGSYPQVQGGANLYWGSGGRLVFLAYLDDWPHLYSIAETGGDPLLLTPGPFMVEHVAQSRDRRFMIYAANTGTAPEDLDRRHLFRVAVDRPGAVALTSGETLEWQPVAAGEHTVAFVTAGPQAPPSIARVDFDGQHRTALAAGKVPDDFPLAQLVTPKPVTFKAADGLLVHGQLFAAPGGAAAGNATRPGIIFVHGGPPRQMLLGWHYMQYYSNAYAVNQYLATHGFTVLSVNYRLGIGYGRAYHQPEHAGAAGSAEYQDVVAGGRFLQTVAGVDPKRIGIWGGSYGGLLTALALARDSALFGAGVDLHGVHDWSKFMDDFSGGRGAAAGFEKGDREAATKIAWESSPVASMATWKSPVLLIQGDDDRNVPFQQTVDLARRLHLYNVPFEELVIPNEIHGFLRRTSWQLADEATTGYFARIFKVPAK